MLSDNVTYLDMDERSVMARDCVFIENAPRQSIAENCYKIHACLRKRGRQLVELRVAIRTKDAIIDQLRERLDRAKRAASA